jgi:hypothetical protein
MKEIGRSESRWRNPTAIGVGNKVKNIEEDGHEQKKPKKRNT